MCAAGRDPYVMSETPTHVDLPAAVTPHPLHLTVDPWWDTLHCLAFGAVSDGIAADQRLVADGCELIFVVADPEAGPVLGFEIGGLADFMLPEEDPEVWDGPRFDVPRLGLVGASAGEIVLAVRAQFGRDPTPTRCISTPRWRRGRCRTPSRTGSWRWMPATCARTSASATPLSRSAVPIARTRTCCEALDRISEARTAYEHAIAVEALCDMDTDAAERLARLDA